MRTWTGFANFLSVLWKTLHLLSDKRLYEKTYFCPAINQGLRRWVTELLGDVFKTLLQDIPCSVFILDDKIVWFLSPKTVFVTLHSKHNLKRLSFFFCWMDNFMIKVALKSNEHEKRDGNLDEWFKLRKRHSSNVHENSDCCKIRNDESSLLRC